MVTKRSSVIAAILSLIVWLPLPSAAEEENDGPYVFFGWGTYKEDSEFGTPVTTNNYAQRIYLGYQFGDFLGLDAGWMDFDRIEYNQGGGNTVDVEADGVHLRARLGLPLSRDNSSVYSFFLTGGFYMWDSTDTAKLNGVLVSETKESDSDVTYGGGLSFMGKSGGMTLEYEVFKIEGPAINNQEFQLMSLNFLILF